MIDLDNPTIVEVVFAGSSFLCFLRFFSSSSSFSRWVEGYAIRSDLGPALAGLQREGCRGRVRLAMMTIGELSILGAPIGARLWAGRCAGVEAKGWGTCVKGSRPGAVHWVLGGGVARRERGSAGYIRVESRLLSGMRTGVGCAGSSSGQMDAKAGRIGNINRFSQLLAVKSSSSQKSSHGLGLACLPA